MRPWRNLLAGVVKVDSAFFKLPFFSNHNILGPAKAVYSRLSNKLKAFNSSDGQHQIYYKKLFACFVQVRPFQLTWDGQNKYYNNACQPLPKMHRFWSPLCLLVGTVLNRYQFSRCWSVTLCPPRGQRSDSPVGWLHFLTASAWPQFTPHSRHISVSLTKLRVLECRRI